MYRGSNEFANARVSQDQFAFTAGSRFRPLIPLHPPQPDRLIRLCDIAISISAIVFLLPLMGLVAMAIYLEDRGEVIFRQSRLGRDGRAFQCLKFRSMSRDAEMRLAAILRDCPIAALEWREKHKLTRDPRITRVGRFIRRTSLDELPQFFNVLRGDMSLVGPRPITDSERERYGRYLVHYCSVRPGITGLWQISGRTETSYKRRIALDVLYIRRRDAVFNLLILVKTVPRVLLTHGAV